eukprot:IDg2281t1
MYRQLCHAAHLKLAALVQLGTCALRTIQHCDYGTRHSISRRSAPRTATCGPSGMRKAHTARNRLMFLMLHAARLSYCIETLELVFDIAHRANNVAAAAAASYTRMDCGIDRECVCCNLNYSLIAVTWSAAPFLDNFVDKNSRRSKGTVQLEYAHGVGWRPSIVRRMAAFRPSIHALNSFIFQDYGNSMLLPRRCRSVRILTA